MLIAKGACRDTTATHKSTDGLRSQEVSAMQQTIIVAEPEPLALNCAETTIIVVDMQNDFCSKNGLFHRAGINVSEIQETVAPTAKVLSTARNAGIRVVYLKMGFRADLSDLGPDDSANRIRHLRLGVGEPCIAPDGRHGRFLIRDTWNTDVIDELRPEPEDVVIYKSRFSGFYQTELDETLRRFRTRNLVFTGCTTSVCVDSTIRDGMFRDYCCLLLADCVGEPIGSEFPRTNHEASILTVKTLLGWVSDSERFETALRIRPVQPNFERSGRITGHRRTESNSLPRSPSATIHQQRER
jgi:ureidoacrylate peracid hydrolase